MNELLIRAFPVLAKLWLRLVSPSTMRLLAPVLGVVLFWLFYRWYSRAGRTALGRAVRWWAVALMLGAVLTGALYLFSVLPDDPDALEAIRSASSERIGRTLFPAPLATAGSVIVAAAAIATAWRWRQARLRPAELAALRAQWQQSRPRWARRVAWTGGIVVAATGTACAAASIGPAQVPSLPATSAGRGTLWVGTASGASRLRLGPNGEAHWEAFVTPRTPLPSDKITGIAADGQGGAWLGTRAGLARAEDNGQHVLWSAQTFENGALPNREVLSITADRQGTVWAATGSGGAVVSSRGDATTFTDQNAPLLHLILDAVYVAPDGLVWFGGAGGVNVYQPPLPGEAQGQWPVGFTRYSTDGALPADLVFAVGGDAKGRIWFGTLSGAAVFTPDRSAYGLGVFEPARWQTLTTSNSPLPDNKVHTLLVDRAGKVWLGTEGGIAVLQETAPGQFQWQQFTAGGARGLPDPWVQALLEAPDGRIWAGTHHGLAVYDPAGPELGWTAYHANPLRRWVGYLWPRYWQANILSDDVTALAWIE